MVKLFLGTSGWSYNGWIGDFYPEDIDRREMLSFYTRHFNSVEVNATFYRLPFKNMIKGWYADAPKEFEFAVKGHRRVTHYNKLEDVHDTITDQMERIDVLSEHLGPVLWQLPPSLHKNVERLERFIALLPDNMRHAIEFRHPSWLDQAVFRLLEKRNIAQVWVSSEQMPAETTETADFIYLRFHGLNTGYRYDYSREELEAWADRIQQVYEHGKTVYAYFNNDYACYAPRNAKMLRNMIYI